jgi:hypothetical protein
MKRGRTMALNAKSLLATGAIIIVLLPLAACSGEDAGDPTANDASEVGAFRRAVYEGAPSGPAGRRIPVR